MTRTFRDHRWRPKQKWPRKPLPSGAFSTRWHPQRGIRAVCLADLSRHTRLLRSVDICDRASSPKRAQSIRKGDDVLLQFRRFSTAIRNACTRTCASRRQVASHLTIPAIMPVEFLIFPAGWRRPAGRGGRAQRRYCERRTEYARRAPEGARSAPLEFRHFFEPPASQLQPL
jgi:hypothetical protein